MEDKNKEKFFFSLFSFNFYKTKIKNIFVKLVKDLFVINCRLYNQFLGREDYIYETFSFFSNYGRCNIYFHLHVHLVTIYVYTSKV